MTGAGVALTMADGNCHSGKYLRERAAGGRRGLTLDAKRKLPGGAHHSACQRCQVFGVFATGRIHGYGSGPKAHEETLLRLNALMATGEAGRASRRWRD